VTAPIAVNISRRVANTGKLLWGGGIRTGRVIGATDKLGEGVTDRRVGPPDFLATIYRHLGIDYETATVPDQTGRPVPSSTTARRSRNSSRRDATAEQAHIGGRWTVTTASDTTAYPPLWNAVPRIVTVAPSGILASFAHAIWNAAVV
jgi:hypothetical protein